MGFVVLGAALGVLVMGLLRTWNRYEAESMAALREENLELRDLVDGLSDRVEALEAIAAGEPSDSRIDPSHLSHQSGEVASSSVRDQPLSAGPVS